MISRLNKKGFTIVELLIVIVVIGILAGLVVNTFSGIQSRARDAERRSDVNAAHSHLEKYYVDNDQYPTDANFVDATWVDANLEGLDVEATIDPSSGNYAYDASDSAGGDCDNSAADLCVSYTLSADLESDGRGTADADSDTADFSSDSLN